jgi:hypothetical protein
VNATQLFFGVLIVIIVVGVACYFSWREFQALAGLRRSQVSPEDRTYAYFKAWRRLACSALMLAFAVLFSASFFLEPPADRLVEQGQAARDRNQKPRLDPSQVEFWQVYRNLWVVMLLLLLAILALAGWDYFAIRRFAQRHYRQLQEERRTMIENELVRLRSRHNGHHG